MKIFTNQKIWKRLVVVLLIIMAFQFVIPNISKAEDGDDISIGGKLLEPIIDLVVAIGDRSFKFSSRHCYATN